MNSQNETLKGYLPPPPVRRRYYTLSQLRSHNTPNNLWVSFFHDIYDLTHLIQLNRTSLLVQPLISAGGTDITHWFDPKNKDPRTCILNGTTQYYLPQGQYLHLHLKEEDMVIPWWKNQEYLIGKLTTKSVQVRIINTLADTEDKIQVPHEETINEILERYLPINAHARSYTWKRKGKILNMGMTLAQNGIIDQSQIYAQNQVPKEKQYIPALHLHFNDDLTTK